VATRRDRRRLLLVALVWFHVLCPVALVVGGTLDQTDFRHKSDAWRFHHLVTTPGHAYRDFDAEYPPGALVYFEALVPTGFHSWAVRLVATQALCDAAIAVALFVAGGVGALVRYLLLSAPLLPFVLTKYDLLPAALAVVAMVLVRRRAGTVGGVLLAASVFTKLWTGALVIGLAARRRWSDLRAALCTLAAGLALWVAYGGIGGVTQVATFRGAKGWHAESGPGVLLELVTGGPLHMESGSWRLGAPPHVFNTFLALLLAAAVSAVWWLVHRNPERDTPGVAEAAVVAAVLVFAPLLSPQFLIWLVPFVALAGAARARDVEAGGVIAIALTMLVVVGTDPGRVDALWAQLVLLARNGAVFAVFVLGCRHLRAPAGRAGLTRPSVAAPATMGRGSPAA
jgi:hypothetical protein